MSSIVQRAAVCAALGVLAACSDGDSPVEPRSNQSGPSAASAAVPQTRHERLAYRLALALRDREFRTTVYQTLAASPFREGKVHLQPFLGNDRGKHRRRLAELAQETDVAVAADLDEATPIEVYLPVPAHRRAWKGDPNVLVATAERDHDAPVGFDPKGRRILLDPEVPPKTPVIALGRAELDFDAAGPAGASTDGQPALVGSSPGLWMTYAKLNSTFEGWLKGAPEIEVHMLGQEGGSKVMTSYQCAGERSGGPYFFNMDEKEWRGSVILFSQAQLDSYKARYPGQALRILLLEDDDAPCVIKTDSSRFTRLIQAIEAKFGELTGGKDTVISIKVFRKARTLMDILKLAWSWLQTQDDIVGLAIEDAVAREYWPGANWILKGDNTATQGAIRLEMR